MKFVTLALAVFVQTISMAQYKTLSKADYDKALFFAQHSMGQYMVNDSEKPPVIIDTISSWKGFELKLYTYKMPSDKLTPNLVGRVILCNPSADKLVKWCVNALIKCDVTVNYFNVLQVLNTIKGCSGAQFPVRGIVYEDIAPKDRINETYAFFDGVTIEGNGITISTKAGQRATKTQEDDYLKMTFKDIDRAILYGRIISTTREDYKKVFPEINTKGTNWVNVVRKEYQDALRSDENNLIYATIYADLQLKDNHKEKKFHFSK